MICYSRSGLVRRLAAPTCLFLVSNEKSKWRLWRFNQTSHSTTSRTSATRQLGPAKGTSASCTSSSSVTPSSLQHLAFTASPSPFQPPGLCVAMNISFPRDCTLLALPSDVSFFFFYPQKYPGITNISASSSFPNSHPLLESLEANRQEG